MPRTRGAFKAYERAIARKVGAQRIPVTGRTGPMGDPGDMDLAGYYTEIRDRKRARPLRWMMEAWKEARRRGRKPLVIFKGPAPHLSPLVVMRWNDFAEVFNRAQRDAGAGPDAGRPGQDPAAAAHGGGQGESPSSGSPAEDPTWRPRPGQGYGPGG